MPKPIHLIVACAENRVIGRGGRLPWSIPEDTAWFLGRTRGHTVVLGRRSYEDWRDAADDRDVIVVTRDSTLARPGARVWTAPTLDAALALAEHTPTRGEILICGGERLYEEALPRADRLLLTLVHAEVEGDTRFPDWRGRFTREVARRESRDAQWRYTFLELVP